MINPATASQLGGVQLAGILGGGTALIPAPANGYITAAMLHDAYALASALTTETARATAAELALTSAYEAAVAAEITARTTAINDEATTRASADTALNSTLTTLQSESTSTNTSVASLTTTVTGLSSSVATLNSEHTSLAATVTGNNNTLTTNLASEASTRASADSTITASVTTVANHLETETVRATTAENTKLTKTSNLSDVSSASAARTNLGLGTAATQSVTAFDSAGSAAAVQTSLNSEITRATAAEGTKLVRTANLSDVSNVATVRANLGLGSAAQQPTSAFDTAGTSAAETTRAQAAEGLKANDNAVVHLSGTETVTGNKNFTGTLSQGGNAVVTTTDSRLTNARTPSSGSVTDASVASGGLTNASIATAAAIAGSKLDSATQTAITHANSAVQSINGRSGNTVTLAPADISAIPNSIIQTKGDIVTGFSSADPQNLPVGPDGTVLVANSGDALGLGWAIPGAFPATVLPTASANYRGAIVYLEGNGTSTADIAYICLRSATGTYSWKQIVSG